jgi:hypothetical protein
VGSTSQRGQTHEWAVSAGRADPPGSERERARAKKPAPTIWPHRAEGGRERAGAAATDRRVPRDRRSGRARRGLAGLGRA